MTYRTYKTYINKFNFPNPNWESIPNGIFNLNKKLLSKEESHLLDAIKLAWLTGTEKGRTILYKNIARLTATFAVIIFVTILGRYIIKEYGKSIINSVNAATQSATFRQGQISIDGIIESTMSAIMGKSKYEK